MSRSASNADAATTGDDLEENTEGSIGSNEDHRSIGAVENAQGKFDDLFSQSYSNIEKSDLVEVILTVLMHNLDEMRRVFAP